MTDTERVFERLRNANPHPTRPLGGKPSAHEMLERVRTGGAADRARARPVVRRPRRGVAVAAAAFAAALLLTIPALFLLGGGDEPVVTNPPTTVQPTTSTTVLSTTVPVTIDSETDALLQQFIATYNSGDVEAVMALLAPDLRREIILDRDIQTQPLETVRILYEVDAALNTELTLACSPGEETIVCSPERFDDLHRVLRIPPSEVTDWLLRFEDGRLAEWGEVRVNAGVIPYQAEAVMPFTDWVEENHPDVPQLYSSGSDTWIPRPDAATQIAALVHEWAESRGISLDG